MKLKHSLLICISGGIAITSQTLNAQTFYQCIQCKSGTYATSTGCEPCPKGYYCLGGTNKTACPAGTYNNITGATSANSCKTCSAGTYSSSTGQTSCTKCPYGYYCTGGTNKTACPAGKYTTSQGASSSSSCKVCPKGQYYISSMNTPFCHSCPKGYRCSNGIRTACPDGTTTKGQGSTSSDTCYKVNYFIFKNSSGDQKFNVEVGKTQYCMFPSGCNILDMWGNFIKGIGQGTYKVTCPTTGPCDTVQLQKI